MNTVKPQDIIAELFRNNHENVYAILDGARNEKIYDAVQQSGVSYVCLYAGAIPQKMQRVAPWLVKLWATHPFTEELLSEGWSKSWGVFATSRVNLETMRRHLRHFLRVKTEDGRRLVFRYYDPRVLRTYLPTCTKQELTLFYGPISRFAMEGHNAIYEEFNRSGNVFSYRHVNFLGV